MQRRCNHVRVTDTRRRWLHDPPAGTLIHRQQRARDKRLQQLDNVERVPGRDLVDSSSQLPLTVGDGDFPELANDLPDVLLWQPTELHQHGARHRREHTIQVRGRGIALHASRHVGAAPQHWRVGESSDE